MPADVHLALLESVRIASPCHVRWDDMSGDDMVRHCASCNLNVHNLSAMSREETEALFSRAKESGSRLCAGMFKRTDGTIILQDCPVGLAAARARVVRLCGRIAAAVALLLGAAVGSSRAASARWEEWGWAMRLKNAPPIQWVKQRVCPSSGRGGWVGGVVCLPSSAPPPSQVSNTPPDFSIGPHFNE